MKSLMIDAQLTVTSIMRHTERVHGDKEIVSVTSDNPCHRYTYIDAFCRARKLANALNDFGLEQGDRIGTLAWNDYRHFELYYGVSCSGFVCHTINPRLFPEQIEYIINHAEDQWIFLDPMFLPLIEQLENKLPSVKGFVIMTTADQMPEPKLKTYFCYETLIEDQADIFEWPSLDENSACSMCYTSGTTGNPKGVVYSHRSTVLHAMSAAMPTAMDLGSGDVVMPVVPMFHVNAWGTPYTCPLVGAKLVFSGPKMADGATLTQLINEEQVNYSLGVPTIWLALANYLEQSGKQVKSLDRLVVGGAACPLALMKTFESYGVWVEAAWGMTEISPLGTYNRQKKMEHHTTEYIDSLRVRAGQPAYGVEIKIVDEGNIELPWDGESSGILKVRGPWVCHSYYGHDQKALDEDGWLDTGDVASVNPEGYMKITDRTKDIIKSGGEWISSIDIENVAMEHSDIAEAAVIGIPHPKWTERPLLLAILKPDAKTSEQDILSFMSDKMASWWIPERCMFIEEIPHTATGKVSKRELRLLYESIISNTTS